MKPFYGVVNGDEVLCIHVEDKHILCVDVQGVLLYHPLNKITFNRLVI